MTSYSAKKKAEGKREKAKGESRTVSGQLSTIARLLVFLSPCLIPLLYFATMARTPVIGDPTEYTFVAHVLGVAHPPGYALMTLISKLYQTLIPLGEIAWRTHFVGVTAGTVAALCVGGMVKALTPEALTPSPSPATGEGSKKTRTNLKMSSQRRRFWPPLFAFAKCALAKRPLLRERAGVRGSSWPAIFAAFIVAFAANHWQHSIHANPHIITAMFLAINLYTLTKWFVAFKRRRTTDHGPRTEGAGTSSLAIHNSQFTIHNFWLYAFCLSAGLGVTHHPLTAFALPACAVFVLWVHPRILLDWKTLLKGTAVVLLGMLPWLYFPIRAAALDGTQFVSNMNTLNGFLDLVLARGLRVNLFAFGLSDQWDRLTVFWTLLRLQHSLPVVFLALIGLGWLVASKQLSVNSEQFKSVDSTLAIHNSQFTIHNFLPLLFLYLGTFALNYLFVMNTVQDVMAYLLGPFLIVGLLAGIGMMGLIDGLQRSRLRLGGREMGLLLALLFMMGPAFQLVRTLPFVSLRNYSEGVDYMAAVRTQFADSGEGAALLNDWEHMTPLWYEMLVEDRAFDEANVTPKFVSAALPWAQGVFDNLPAGPVYLSRFERSVFDAGFRLRPRGETWQVVEPGDGGLPPELTPISGQGGAVEIVGYRLPQEVRAGQLIDFDLAMRVAEVTPDIYMPVLKVGDATLGFTTDSHLLTPQWQPNEIIVERFEFVTPHDWPAQEAPVTLEVHDLTGGTGDTGLRLDLGALIIEANSGSLRTDRLLANFRQRAGLADAWVRNGVLERRHGVYEEPLVVSSNDTVHIMLEWEVLAKPEDSYTVFVHLIDGANRPIIDSLDYTPLGGATPSHLWFPKWLSGQTMLDPYQMPLDGVPPGEYLIEVGLYEQFTKRRLHIYDADGNINGDRLILGKIVVQ